MDTTVPENGHQLKTANFYMNDTCVKTGHTIKSLGTVYEGTDSPADMYLGDTSVVACGDKIYRAVAIKKGETCNLYCLSADDEEGLIQRAVATAPGLKISWARWVGMAKTKMYPNGASDLERAVFGPHCMLSSVLVERRVARKRERDTASRNKRRVESPRAPPRKVIKVEADAPSTNTVATAASAHGTIRLTLELPAASSTATSLVRSALAGMVDAMPL